MSATLTSYSTREQILDAMYAFAHSDAVDSLRYAMSAVEVASYNGLIYQGLGIPTYLMHGIITGANNLNTELDQRSVDMHRSPIIVSHDGYLRVCIGSHVYEKGLEDLAGIDASEMFYRYWTSATDVTYPELKAVTDELYRLNLLHGFGWPVRYWGLTQNHGGW
jgi:hypothetical protein